VWKGSGGAVDGDQLLGVVAPWGGGASIAAEGREPEGGAVSRIGLPPLNDQRGYETEGSPDSLRCAACPRVHPSSYGPEG
jgi:hypothetical protein